MEYTITVRETLEKEIKVKASSEREALDLVRDDYEHGGIVLDSSNHTSTEYVDEKGKVIAVWM
jgi:hypothetical protein